MNLNEIIFVPINFLKENSMIQNQTIDPTASSCWCGQVHLPTVPTADATEGQKEGEEKFTFETHTSPDSPEVTICKLTNRIIKGKGIVKPCSLDFSSIPVSSLATQMLVPHVRNLPPYAASVTQTQAAYVPYNLPDDESVNIQLSFVSSEEDKKEMVEQRTENHNGMKVNLKIAKKISGPSYGFGVLVSRAFLDNTSYIPSNFHFAGLKVQDPTQTATTTSDKPSFSKKRKKSDGELSVPTGVAEIKV